MRSRVRFLVFTRDENIHEATLRLNQSGTGNFFIGPVCHDPDLEDSERLTERQNSVVYLTNVLLDAPNLGTVVEPHEPHLKRRLIHHAIGSIVFPLTILFNCVNSEVLTGDERMTIAKRMLTEFVAVSNFPSLTYEKLEFKLKAFVAGSYQSPFNTMFNSVVTGGEYDVEVSQCLPRAHSNYQQSRNRVIEQVPILSSSHSP